MPDDRFFHKRAGHSEKVNSLTDFEELIWRYYLLSADDFGVMRFDHRQIQNDHERAGKRSSLVVTKALVAIHTAGLVDLFEHQGRSYCYSRNWQRYQKIDYPRETHNPCPPVAELSACEPDTYLLFLTHPGGKVGRDKKLRLKAEGIDVDSVSVRRMDAESIGEHFRLTRAGALAQAEATGKGSEGGPGETTPPARAGAFCEWYGETHERLVGVGYIGNPRKDYESALLLVAKFSDQELRDAALVWFGMDDDFARNGTRTITKFASRASHCVQVARKVSA